MSKLCERNPDRVFDYRQNPKRRAAGQVRDPWVQHARLEEEEKQ